MRIPTALLALLVLISAPLTAQAQRHHSSGRIYIPPPKLHAIKPQSVHAEAPAVVAARERALNQAGADLDAIAPGSAATPPQKAAIEKDLRALVDGSNRPSAVAVRRLSTDLADLLARRPGPSPIDTATLARDLKVVMNSAYAMTTDVHKAIRDGQAVLKASGVGDADARLIADDLRAISTEMAAKGQPGMIQ